MRRSIQLAGTLTVHAGFVIILAVLMTAPSRDRSSAVESTPLMWTAPTPGTGSGGGQGGDGRRASPAPLRRVVSQDAPRFVLPRMPEVLGALELPGVPVAFAAPAALGSGTDTGPGGRGEGRDGPGIGTGDGPGAGPGDGPFVDGSPGLTSPRLVSETKPEYTPAAMTARVQGAVLLEAVVREDGRVGDVKVLRSLDRSHGLDEKAVEAIRRWKFEPGTFHGRPVAVRVLVELYFTLR